MREGVFLKKLWHSTYAYNCGKVEEERVGGVILAFEGQRRSYSSSVPLLIPYVVVGWESWLGAEEEGGGADIFLSVSRYA